MEGFLVPVVRNIVVLSVRVSEGRIRIELEILSDELLSLRNSEYLIAKTAVVLVKKSGVGICVCFLRCLACIYLRVVHHLVMSLVVLGRVCNYIILRNQS